MLRVTLRNLLARKVRLLLSAFAIVLGVAFVAGTLVFTNAMGGAFDDIIEGSTSDVEVAYPGATDFDSVQDARTIDAGVVEDLEALPGGRRGLPQRQPAERLPHRRGRQGRRRQRPARAGVQRERRPSTSPATPSWSTSTASAPSGPGQVALDEAAAENGGYVVGDDVQVTTPGEPPVMTRRAHGHRAVRRRGRTAPP